MHLLAADEIRLAPHRRRPDDDLPSYATALEAELKKAIKGEVRFDTGSRALYSTDASNYRQVPIGVVCPRTIQDVVETVRLAREHGAPILGRGGATSLAGQCCNAGIVVDFSKYLTRIVALDPEAKVAQVEPGIVLDWLRDEAERYDLTFGPDPATHSRCTLGGMIGNNSCGTHALMAGKTEENIEELEVLTYDGLRLRVGATSETEIDSIVAAGGRRGQIYADLRKLRDRYQDVIRTGFPDIPRRVSGFNLQQLLPENGFHLARALVGTESTCVLVLEATTRLVKSPQCRNLLVLGFDDVYQAADAVPNVLTFKPIACEGFDGQLIDHMRAKGRYPVNSPLLPEGRGWLLIEFGADSNAQADADARRLMKSLEGMPHPPRMKLYDNRAEQKLVWKIREAALAATAWVPGQPAFWEGWEDSAVDPGKLGAYLRELCTLYEKHQYQGALYGHFGQGCVHSRISFDLVTPAGIQRYRDFVSEAVDLVLKYGGSLSGEHGDGQSRAEFLPRMYGAELMEAFREFKRIWDPEGKMNPGKVIGHEVAPVYRIDENLRLGTDYQPAPVHTHFAFRADNRNFAQSTLRCVGVGACRNKTGGTMCPSYRVTMEEQHSTRGRAHLLFEMIQGQVIKDGWRSEEVFDSLDLCLACKGCKSDCPVDVDMASYKAEFLAHYYEGRVRPRSAYSMGLIYWWARIASHIPQLVNFVTQTPGLATISKAIAGVEQQRPVPRFATYTFKDWFARTKPHRVQTGPQVILWADTFNNYFHPAVPVAATEVLEAAGFRVLVPKRSLCCGRPLYDQGMLSLAKTLLQQIVNMLRPKIRAGVPVVGLEPSCVSVFRDELPELLPDDPDAERLAKQTYTLAEFLTQKAPDFDIPRLHANAIVHGHCHHKAVLGFSADIEVLKRTGVNAEILDSGCCGLAGTFGFEPHKYEMSKQIGDLVLLPAVRSAAKESLIIADGFSCKTQIEQMTDRQAVHLAQVLQIAIRHGQVTGQYPERRISVASAAELRSYGISTPNTIYALAAAAALSGLALALKARGSQRAMPQHYATDSAKFLAQ